MMPRVDVAIQRAIDAKSNIYNLKRNCPESQRDAELRNLYDLATFAPDGAAVEIGVKRGGSFLCWSMAREGRGNLYAVDDWSSKTEKPFRDNCALYDVDVTVLGMKSADAAPLITEPLAFVFVDGSHDIGIWDDVKVWPPKIVPGGIIAFHDYDVWKPTVKVKAAVDEWQASAKWEYIGQVRSTIAYRRPERGY